MGGRERQACRESHGFLSVSTQNQTLGSVTADHEVKVIDILSYWAMSSLHYTVMMHRITSKNQLWWRSCNFTDFHEKMNHNGFAHDKLLGYRAAGIWPHYRAQCQTNSSQNQMYCHCRRSDQKKKEKKGMTFCIMKLAAHWFIIHVWSYSSAFQLCCWRSGSHTS